MLSREAIEKAFLGECSESSLEGAWEIKNQNPRAEFFTYPKKQELICVIDLGPGKPKPHYSITQYDLIEVLERFAFLSQAISITWYKRNRK